MERIDKILKLNEYMREGREVRPKGTTYSYSIVEFSITKVAVCISMKDNNKPDDGEFAVYLDTFEEFYEVVPKSDIN